MDNTRCIRAWLNIGLGAKLIQTAAQLFIWLIMGCRDMNRLVLLPLISTACASRSTGRCGCKPSRALNAQAEHWC